MQRVRMGNVVKKNVIFSMVMLLLLVGCSSQFASHGERMYLRSRNGPSVVVPPPLTDTNTSHFYDLPAQQKKHPKVSVVPPPAPTHESL